MLVGSIATLVVALALLVPVMLLGFDRFFEDFHGVFFEGDSWRFARGDTLLRIYPEQFWERTSQAIAIARRRSGARRALRSRWFWQRRVPGGTT